MTQCKVELHTHNIGMVQYRTQSEASDCGLYCTTGILLLETNLPSVYTHSLTESASL